MPIAPRIEPSSVHMSSGHVFRTSSVLLAQGRVQHCGSQIIDEMRVAEGSRRRMSKKPSHPRLALPRRIPKMNAVVSQRATPLKVRLFASPSEAFHAKGSDPFDPPNLSVHPVHFFLAEPLLSSTCRLTRRHFGSLPAGCLRGQALLQDLGPLRRPRGRLHGQAR